jgi:hypothetical protein
LVESLATRIDQGLDGEPSAVLEEAALAEARQLREVVSPGDADLRSAPPEVLIVLAHFYKVRWSPRSRHSGDAAWLPAAFPQGASRACCVRRCAGPLVAEMMPSMGVGILAFGSIVEQPGAELAATVTRRVEAETPFAIEFARSSRTRDGAPTLVPVNEGGAHVPASVFVLDNSITVADARAMLYRRETGRPHDMSTGSRGDWIAELTDFGGLDTCLYTALPANIQPLTAQKLADLALCSAAASVGAERRDGISYLQQQKRPRDCDSADASLRGSGAKSGGGYTILSH